MALVGAVALLAGLLAACSSGGSTGSARSAGSNGSAAPTTRAARGAAAVTVGSPASRALAPVRRQGDTYVVPDPVGTGSNGSLLAASTTGPDRSVDAAQRWVFLYRSQDMSAHTVAVSGQLVVPRGTPPSGGWPVVSWAHGTSGIADRCTPSQHDFWDDENAQEVRTFVDAGYAVAATDYPGLGTPGVHPYLVGVDEGNAVADVVAAAHHLTSHLSPTWFAVGHSQGGQAVLFATRSAARDPQLHLAATVSMAPASALNAILPAVISLGDLDDQAYAVFALIGLAQADPSVQLGQVLGPGALARLDIAEQTGCVDQADAAFRQAPTSTLFSLTSTRMDQLDDELNRTGDPDTTATVGPVLVLQGTTDTDVPAGATAAVVSHLAQLGSTITEKTYAGLDHDGLVGPSECDQLAFLAAHGGRPMGRCTSHPTDLH